MKNRILQLLNVLVSFLFVAGALFAYQEIPLLAFWISIILFGGGGLATLRSLLNPAYFSANPNGPLFAPTLVQQVKSKQDDSGVFTYDATGFSYMQYPKSEAIRCNWTDVESLFGYNISYYDDRYTVDEVNLDIFTSNYEPISIMQSTRGWHQFINRLSENIPTVPRRWAEKIAGPPFGKNLTLLYDKRGRTKEEVEKVCYPDKYDDQ